MSAHAEATTGSPLTNGAVDGPTAAAVLALRNLIQDGADFHVEIDGHWLFHRADEIKTAAFFQ